MPRAFLATLFLSALPLAALAEPSPVKVAEVSARLYAMGLETGDPLMIMTAAKLRKTTLKLQLAIGQGGKAFGAITTADIAAAIASQLKVTVDRHAIYLEKPIKTTGKHEVTVRVHPEVEAIVRLSISTPEEPAEKEEEAAE